MGKVGGGGGGVYAQFSESHASMRVLDSNSSLSSASNASTISTANAGRSQYRTSIHEESCMKVTKTPLFFTDLRKIECLAPRVSHMCKEGNHVTFRIHITRGQGLIDPSSL